MIDKTHEPTEEEILGFVGEEAREAWLEIQKFITDSYHVLPEIVFYGEKYGWTVRYRKSGKALCSLYPEKGGFTVQIVLGRKEFEEAHRVQDELSSKIRELLANTKQLHDGRWLWIRVLTMDDADDVKKLLEIKRRPKKGS